MKILKLKSILFSLMAIAMATVFLSSCTKDSTEVVIPSIIDNTDLIKLVNSMHGKSSIEKRSTELTSEESKALYRSLNEKELEQLIELLTPAGSKTYYEDIKFRKSVLTKSKELFNKPFNQLTYEEEEKVFDNVDANVLIYENYRTKNLKKEGYINSREDEPSWCPSSDFPLYLDYTNNPTISWHYWTFISRIENGVTSSDCDVRFVYRYILNNLNADWFFKRTAKYHNGRETWHFVGLGRLNWVYGQNSSNWPRLVGRV